MGTRRVAPTVIPQHEYEENHRVLAERNMRTLMVILQHLRRYFDRYVRQRSPVSVSKVSSSLVAATESRYGIRTEIDRYLRRAD